MVRATWIFAAISTAALIGAVSGSAGWYEARSESRQLGELKPIAALLKEDPELLQALQTDSESEKGSGILASYLSKIRADGLPKHADTKQRLDRLAENNSAIVALIGVYSSRPKTAAFSAEASKFVRYAIA